VIIFIAVLVFMASVYYLVRVRRHPEETTREP
jgi:uncharacterized membrane protein